MPRGVGIQQGGAAAAPRTASSKSHNKNNTNKPIKIKIRPFSKPPQLPDHYYEETSQLILQGTLAALKQQQQQQQQQQQGSSPIRSSSRSLATAASSTSAVNSSSWSLQNAYQACVHLVRHHYGPRLYQDLVQTLQEAAELVLQQPSSDTKETTNHHLLTYICQQYQTYTEFLLLLKHICLPLDNSGATTSTTMTATSSTSSTVTSSSAAAAAAAAASNSNSSNTSTSLWSTGLRVFLERLQVLEWDVELYRQWLTQFLQDWDQYHTTTTTTTSTTTTHSNIHGCSEEQRQTLRSVWYLFQDLQMLSHLPLQQDLEEHWAEVARQWQCKTATAAAASMYPLREFLQLCTDKFQAAVTLWRPWLPPVWLTRILQQQLVQPHLTSEYLLKEQHLFPVLLEEWNHPHHHHHHSIMNHNSPSHARYTPIQQLWMLAGRLPGGTASVAAVLRQFCRQQGLQCVLGMQQQQQQQQLKITPQPNAVPELLELQQRIATLTQQLIMVSHNSSSGSTSTTTTPSFSASSSQQQSPIPLKSVWEEVVNVDVAPCLAEQLAKFLDSILRSNKKMDQYAARDEDWLPRILNGLFIPLQAKDVFEAFYKRDLAKRLLWNRVVSMDIEKQVCSLLKAECGAGYTSKMEGMFQDVDWSRETMLVYKQSLQGAASASSSSSIGAAVDTSSSASSNNPLSASSITVDVEVQVLTTGYWPVYPQYPNLQLPDNLKVPQEHFANHYKTKYQGRRMSWQYALGHCVVKAHGFAKPYELIVSLCQALVLIQFHSDSEPLTLPQLKLLTGLEDRDEMERILQSLALGKDGTRILRKLDHDRMSAAATGSTKKTRPNVDDRDEFVVNAQFSSNARRIRIQNVMIKETREERTKTVESVARDRLYLIDAVLVRIMKARKTILHQALIPQVMEQIKVPAQPADIKKRIESLIEREYLERDAKDRNRYNYLA